MVARVKKNFNWISMHFFSARDNRIIRAPRRCWFAFFFLFMKITTKASRQADREQEMARLDWKTGTLSGIIKTL